MLELVDFRRRRVKMELKIRDTQRPTMFAVPTDRERIPV